MLMKVNVTDCTRLNSMERCANVPGCMYCLSTPSFFEQPADTTIASSKRRDLKSPLPTIDPGSSLPIPTSGQCVHVKLSDNTCYWDELNAKVRDEWNLGGVSFLIFSVMAVSFLIYKYATRRDV
jgi:hypothetical protein